MLHRQDQLTVTFSSNTHPGSPRQHRQEAEGQAVGVCHPHRLDGRKFNSTRHPLPALIPASTLPSQVLTPPPPSAAAGAGCPFGFLRDGILSGTSYQFAPGHQAQHGCFLLLPLSRHCCPQFLTCYQQEGVPGLPPAPWSLVTTSPHTHFPLSRSIGPRGSDQPMATCQTGARSQQVPEVTSPRETRSLQRSLGQTTLEHKLPRATGTGAMATGSAPCPPGDCPEVTQQTGQGPRNMNKSPGQQG